jgi:hypothetical protein
MIDPVGSGIVSPGSPSLAPAMSRIETQYSSPNHSDRAGRKVRMIVLHSTVGGFHSSLSWLCSPKSKVSTHYLLSKTGRVLRLVAEERAAWHAGVSQWFDLDSDDIQLESIGIELENMNTGRDPYPPAQYAALLELCRPIIARYRIAPDMFVRHSDIAIPRGRKTDPAGFPWDAFKKEVFAPAEPQPPPAPAPAGRILFVLIAPCAPLTARNPSAPLASGIVFKVGDVVNVGVDGSMDGWLWVSDKPDTAPGIGWIPSAYAVRMP